MLGRGNAPPFLDSARAKERSGPRGPDPLRLASLRQGRNHAASAVTATVSVPMMIRSQSTAPAPRPFISIASESAIRNPPDGFLNASHPFNRKWRPTANDEADPGLSPPWTRWSPATELRFQSGWDVTSHALQQTSKHASNRNKEDHQPDTQQDVFGGLLTIARARSCVLSAQRETVV
jgi:hypothetical protein